MRIRTIKPEFFLHVELFEAEREFKLPLRISFAGLWCAADREGRFKWEPRKLGVQILPYDNLDFSRVLDALTTRGFIVKYASNGCDYGFIPGFSRHQVINNKERQSEIPEPPEDLTTCNATATREPREGDACHKEGKGRERNITLFEGDSAGCSSTAESIIEHLNSAAGRKFDIKAKSHLQLVKARLAEVENDADGVKRMIDRWVKLWRGTPQEEYLTPTTLFAPQKFRARYDMRDVAVNVTSEPAWKRDPNHKPF